VSDLHVVTWGDGDPVVFVHGSLSWGEEAWAAQRPLAAQYRLIVPDRRGFGASPGPDVGDFERDAADIAGLLDERSHLVGHSYGAVACLIAATQRPEAVRSLTVVEPPALGLARGDDAVEEFLERITAAKAAATDPQDYVARFFDAFGFPPPTARLNEKALRCAASSWRERDPSEAEIPLDDLARAPFPKLVVSGAWDQAPPEAQRVGRAAFHAVRDVLVARLGAECAVIDGVAHAVPQAAGERFNERLRAFWAQSSTAG
jgi:pimeloyl-ACP methyl ester carboxylesterase